MILFYIIVALMIMGVENHNTSKRIRERDNNPYNTVKSDRWKREHGLL